MKPDIVVTARPLPALLDQFDAAFACHRLYDAKDRDAFWREVGPMARGLATFAGFRVDAALLNLLPRLEIVSNFGVGVDSIDLAEARSRGIIVTNTPDVLNDCVADTALALVLNLLRQFPRAEAHLRAGEWAARGPYPLTTSLGGKTLGILGLGRIGTAIAQRAESFGMDIRYHNRNRKNIPYAYDPSPVALARNADVLLVATPGGAETNRLVGAAVLDALGPDGYLVNIARGSIVDEPLLLQYLQQKKIAGAGLDVYAEEPRVPPEFYTLDNAVLFPHVGSATIETRTAMGTLQLENLRLYFAGRSVKTRVA